MTPALKKEGQICEPPSLNDTKKERGKGVLGEGTFRKTVDPELWRQGKSDPGEHLLADTEAERTLVQRQGHKRACDGTEEEGLV